MPSVKKGESEKDYVSRCIPYMMKEKPGMKSDQAAAVCHSLYQKKDEDITSKIDSYLILKEAETTESPKEDLVDKIMSFFKDNKNPPDEKIHDLADELKINPHKFEATIYGILSSFMSNGRFNESGMKESDFDKEQVLKGIKVEMEHTNSPKLAKRITFDHLAEFHPLPYYDYLDDMENKMKKDLEKK